MNRTSSPLVKRLLWFLTTGQITLYFCYLGSDFWSSKENLFFFFPLYLTERRVLCVNVYKYIHMTPSCNTTLNIFILLYACTEVCDVQGVGVFYGRGRNWQLNSELIHLILIYICVFKFSRSSRRPGT